MLSGNWRINRSPSMTHEGHRKTYQRVRAIAVALIGEVCKKCGYSDYRALQIDHKKGDGGKDRKKHRGVSYYYFIIRDVAAGNKKKYQILCANCNHIKKLLRQEHPRLSDSETRRNQ